MLYPGDPGTRPMKDRVREAVFNLLGTAVKSTIAVDVFAGTGAMALEAISRGANSAIAVEKNFPMARVIGQNSNALGIADRVRVHAGDAFVWAASLSEQAIASWGSSAWTIFCCPPYALYVDRNNDMLQLVERMLELAPTGSTIVVEADQRFDFATLPLPEDWDVRNYPPAFVGLHRKSESAKA